MKPLKSVPYHWTEIYKPEGSHSLSLTTRSGEIEVEQRFFKLPRPYQDLKTATLQIWPNMVKMKVPSKQPPHLALVRRGAVGLEFSGKMRKRFLDRFNSWHVPNENMYFIHLTYPSEYDQDWHTWKLHLKAFKSHLKRMFPDAEGWWKLELQRRGAPHFHMVIDLRQKCAVKRFRAWVDAVWARIAHSMDQYGGKYACRVEPVFSVRHARNYVCKYMSKLSFAPVDEHGEVMDSSNMRDTMGRLWGRIGKPNCEQIDAIQVDVESVVWMRLQLAHQLKKQGARGWKHLVSKTNFGSFTVYGLGNVADDRFKTASELIADLQKKWVKPFENEVDKLWQLDRLIMGQGG